MQFHLILITRILSFAVFVLLVSACEKEHHIRLEASSTYLPFEWSRPSIEDELYNPVSTAIMSVPASYGKTQTGPVNTWLSVKSLAPDSVFSSIKGAIYIDGQLAGLKMKEGYGSFDIHVSATLKD